MININLIAERRAQRMREILIIRFSALGVGVLFVLMLGFNLAAMFESTALKSEIHAVEDELQALDTQRADLEKIMAKIEEKRPLVTLLDHVRVSEGVWMTVLADLSDVISDDVMLRNIQSVATREGIELRLTGAAKDETTIGEFMVALRQGTEWAMNPELGTVMHEDKYGRTQKRFDLNVPIRDLLGGDL